MASALQKKHVMPSAASRPRPMRVAPRTATRARPPVLPRRSSTVRRPVLSAADEARVREVNRTLDADLSRLDARRDRDRARIERRIREARADHGRTQRVQDERVERASRWEERTLEAVDAARDGLDRVHPGVGALVVGWGKHQDDGRLEFELAAFGLSPPGPPLDDGPRDGQQLLDRLAFAVRLHRQAQEDLATAHAAALGAVRGAQLKYERLVAGRRERLLEVDRRAREDRVHLEREAAEARRRIVANSA